MSTAPGPHDLPQLRTLGPRLRVGVVGAGRVGSVLGAALEAAGHEVVAASAVSEASLERARVLLPRTRIRTPEQVARDCELLLLAVPDDELPGLVAGLASTGAISEGQFVAHPSGRHGIRVLQPATDVGALPLAMHPAMTFSGTPMDLERIPNCVFGVTSTELGRPVAEAHVVEMRAEPVWIAEEDRMAYHAALAHGSNHLVTLVAQAMQVLTHAGVEMPERVLGPLLEASLSNALRAGDGALTGPVSRGDAGTVAGHLESLAQLSPDVVPTYRALARATALRANALGRLPRPATDRVLEVLDGPESPTEEKQ